MRTLLKLRSAMITVTAVAALAAPALAGASILSSEQSADHSSQNKLDLQTAEGQEYVYERLQEVSRDRCGSSDLLLNGSLRRSTANQQCYEETLEVAVQRVDNPGVTRLHKENTL